MSSYIGSARSPVKDEVEVLLPATAEAFVRGGRVWLVEVKDALQHAEAALRKWRPLIVKERGALLHKVAK